MTYDLNYFTEARHFLGLSVSEMNQRISEVCQAEGFEPAGVIALRNDKGETTTIDRIISHLVDNAVEQL